MTDQAPDTIHLTVLKREAVELLNVREAGVFVDATLGLGGHAEALLEAGETVELIGIDQDPAALELAAERLSRFGDRARLANANFSDISRVLRELDAAPVDGIVADLGVSSLQLDSEQRGFSFRYDAPLDMRMDPTGDRPTAAELLEDLSEVQIADIIYRYGEERFSRRIARRDS